MGKLADALRRKYKTPQEAIRALGLDEALLHSEVTGDELPEELRQMTKMDPLAYAYGRGLALAMDASSDRLVQFYRTQIGTDDPVGTTAKKFGLSTQEVRRIVNAAIEKSRGRDLANWKPGQDETVDPAGGANAIAHGAKRMTARAAIAGKTGITGGPPTRHPRDDKGAGLTPSGHMRVPGNIDWPSRDVKVDFSKDIKLTKELDLVVQAARANGFRVEDRGNDYVSMGRAAKKPSRMSSGREQGYSIDINSDGSWTVLDASTLSAIASGKGASVLSSALARLKD